MNELRYYHGCTTTTIAGLKTVLVVGGFGNNGYLNTMEVYDPSKNEWTRHSSLLPIPLYGLPVVPSRSLKYSSYVIGGYGNGDRQTTIYGLNRNQEWKLVGNLKQKIRHIVDLKVDLRKCTFNFEYLIEKEKEIRIH